VVASEGIYEPVCAEASVEEILASFDGVNIYKSDNREPDPPMPIDWDMNMNGLKNIRAMLENRSVS
jgi:hypothetical protein